MNPHLESRPERTTRPVYTGSRAEAEQEGGTKLGGTPNECPSLARTRLELPPVREIRAVR